MFKQLQYFLAVQHHRFIARTRAFGAAVKQFSETSLRYINGLGRLALEHYSNSAYESEHRYGTHVWLYIAIRTIAEKSAMPPLVLKKDDEIVDSPLPPRPNPSASWTDVNELLTIWMELCGNAYLYHDIENDEFYPLRPSRMKVVASDDGKNVVGYAYYKGGAPASNRVDVYTTPSLYAGTNTQRKHWMYDNPEVENLSESEFQKKLETMEAWVTKGVEPQMTVGNPKDWMPLDVDEVLHFKHISPTSGLYGLSPLTPLLITLTTDLFSRQWNKKFFENGAIPPGILVVPGQMSEKEFKRIKNEFHEEYSGVENRGRNIVIRGGEDGATYTAFPGQHRDMEFGNMLSVNRDEILSIYQVPHAMVNAQMNASHASDLSPGIGTYRRIFWQDTIQPKLRKKADIWNKHYDVNTEESGITFSHDYTGIEDLADDYYELGKAAALARQNGWTIEDIREKIYKLPREAEGTFWIPANIRAVDAKVLMSEAKAETETETEGSMEMQRGQK